MIKYFFYLFIFVISYQLMNSCANPASPTGGPRDTIPPLRISTLPADKSINYDGKSIYMEYDERLKTDKLKDQLIITPYLESDYDFIIKKNSIRLNFDEPFSDSTTYTLNFRESIQDITEGNPTKDNKFTFSTGSYIDSLSITGYTKKLLTYDTLENVVVGLYRAEDTITIFDGSPYYFTELLEDNSFLIENIKNGNYLLYAFADVNKNLKLETNSEPYGFVRDTILIDSVTMQYTIDMVNLDLTVPKVLSSLTSGQYYEINFNKYITEYHLLPIDSDHTIYSNLVKDNKSIRFYNNFQDIDSVEVFFTAYDSLDNTVTDTLFIKFGQSSRKKQEFTILLSPEKNTPIENQIDVDIQFNKPISTYNTDSIFVQFDTTVISYVHDSLFTWNKYGDRLQFSIEVDKVKADTILNRRKRMIALKKDSIQQQQEKTQLKQQIDRDKKEELPKINTGLQLYFGIGSFYSADLDTSSSFGYNYKFLEASEYGIQDINITTEYESFILQMLTEQFEIVQESINSKSVKFKNIKPGKYKIRILIDSDKDGKWSPGNMRKQIEPEPVYIYPEVIVIRADWQTSLDLTF